MEEETFIGFDDNVLNFFSNTNRTEDIGLITRNFINSWNTNSVLTLKTLLYTRDIRNGKGEKLISRICLLILKIKCPEVYESILFDIPKYGSWKDILYIHDYALKNNLDLNFTSEINMIYNQLKKDEEIIDNGLFEKDGLVTNKISLCAKWMPNEGSKFKEFAKLLMNKFNESNESNASNASYQGTYRKLLSKLRNNLNLLEKDLVNKNYDNIKFENLPSVAHSNHVKLFKKKIEERYSAYIEEVKNGTKKINVSAIDFTNIIKKIMDDNYSDEIDVLQEQWNSVVNETKGKGTFKKAIAISDVSGSMSGKPMEVAIALGLLISECCEEPYKNHIITFSSNPEIHNLNDITPYVKPSNNNYLRTLFYSPQKESELVTKVKFIKTMNWQQSTNMTKVFELLLDIAVKNKLKQDEMIEKLFILTDMQFNCVTDTKDFFVNVSKKYEKFGYKMPSIVCWNLNNASKVPFSHDSSNLISVSGYSPKILESIMNNTVTDPMTFIKDTLKNYKIKYTEEMKNKIINDLTLHI